MENKKIPVSFFIFGIFFEMFTTFLFLLIGSVIMFIASIYIPVCLYIGIVLLVLNPIAAIIKESILIYKLKKKLSDPKLIEKLDKIHDVMQSDDWVERLRTEVIEGNEQTNKFLPSSTQNTPVFQELNKAINSSMTILEIIETLEKVCESYFYGEDSYRIEAYTDDNYYVLSFCYRYKPFHTTTDIFVDLYIPFQDSFESLPLYVDSKEVNNFFNHLKKHSLIQYIQTNAITISEVDIYEEDDSL